MCEPVEKMHPPSRPLGLYLHRLGWSVHVCESGCPIPRWPTVQLAVSSDTAELSALSIRRLLAREGVDEVWISVRREYSEGEVGNCWVVVELPSPHAQRKVDKLVKRFTDGTIEP